MFDMIALISGDKYLVIIAIMIIVVTKIGITSLVGTCLLFIIHGVHLGKVRLCNFVVSINKV